MNIAGREYQPNTKLTPDDRSGVRRQMPRNTNASQADLGSLRRNKALNTSIVKPPINTQVTKKDLTSTLVKGSNATEHDKLVKQTRTWVAQTFFGTMLKQMRESPFKSEVMDGGRGGQAFGSMYDQQLAERMSKGAGANLVNSIVHRIEARAAAMREKLNAANGIEAGTPTTPSPGTPGEGRGEGSRDARNTASQLNGAEDPHPHPLPDYRARGQMQMPRITGRSN